jgi:hypothetical protein
MTDLPHCKNPEHLRVESGVAGTVLGEGILTATYVPAFRCHQTPDYDVHVIVLGRVRKPLTGLHLLPSAWAFVAGGLRACATATPDAPIGILHTVGGAWKPWHAMTAQAALDLSAAIMAAAEGHE